LRSNLSEKRDQLDLDYQISVDSKMTNDWGKGGANGYAHSSASL